MAVQRHQSKRDKPSDLDGKGFSDKSYRPGYSLDKSLKDSSEEDLKRGYKRDNN